ncbi:MAG: hypothetical protein JSW61_11240 [Candidatus Thorarchaeota archaeon]|nr:MAG: hypothetical protein JSW61_11240 [Candidatus Thorarchaeota archaeon]
MGDFYPISPLINITNTSYAAQAGVMDEKWAARIVRGKKIITEKTVLQLDLDAFVGVIYGHIRLPGLSRHAVAQCAGRLMQFARKYQTSGVAPNFEIPDLVRDEMADEDIGAAEDASTYSEVSVDDSAGDAVETLEQNPIGALPEIAKVEASVAWENDVEANVAVIQEMAAYGASLPEGHLSLMFDRAADALVRHWCTNEDPVYPVLKFGQLILSCSTEGQVPSTSRTKLTLETGTCRLLTCARKLEKSGTQSPSNYPCAFHEMLASKVSYVSGAKINLNISSTGCIVTMSLD